MIQNFSKYFLGATTFLFTLQGLALGVDNLTANRKAIETQLLKGNFGASNAGIQVKNVGIQEIDSVANKFKGKVTVDFGDSKLPYKDGHPPVGPQSSDVDTEKRILAPTQPNMSISVVGNWPGYCAVYIPTNHDSSPALGGASMNDPLCVNDDGFIRITKSGKYVVFPNFSFDVVFGENHFREYFGINNTSMIVNIESGENKIIPLSKIIITGAEIEKNEVLHYLTTDLQSIEEQRKAAYLAYAFRKEIRYGYRDRDGLGYVQIPKECRFDDYNRNMKFLELSDELTADFRQFLSLNECNNKKFAEIPVESRSGIRLKEMKHENYPFKGNFTYTVFPGVYSIRWLIDKQQEVPTRGIQVH